MKKPESPAWAVEGYWATRESFLHLFPDPAHSHRAWQIAEDYQWPKSLRYAIRLAENLRRRELRLRGIYAVPLRLKNIKTGEIREIEWYGEYHLKAKWHVPGEPDQLIMPHKARIAQQHAPSFLN